MTRQAGRRWIGGAFTAATLGWLLLILAVPAALARESGGRVVTLVSAGAYLMGGVVCHQRPDRSFHPGGVQMPVCARCAGLYLGAGVGVLAAGARRRRGIGPAAGAAERRGLGEGRSDGKPSRRATMPGAEHGGETARCGGEAAPGTGAGRAPAWLRWVVLAAAAPTGITFAAEMAGWMPSIGGLRAAAGVPLGVAVTWVASLVIRGDLA